MAETFLHITDPSTNKVIEYNITRLYTGIALNYDNTVATVKFKPNKKTEAIVFNIQQMLEDNKKEPQTFKEYHIFVLNASRYQFWSRCEYEFIMCQWPYDEKNPLNDSHKIDAYAQIEANSEVITNVFIKNINKK